ncbi:hypothetical protein MMPV_005467 [Pyropia vietnamensis]
MADSAGASSGMATAAAAADAYVASTVAAHPVVVFSKTYCPYCSMAKEALATSAKSVVDAPTPHIVELDLREDGAAVQAALARLTRRRTVPNVFVGGTTVGGGDDVAALSRSGVLKQMLRAAPETLSAANAAAAAKAVKASSGSGAAAPGGASPAKAVKGGISAAATASDTCAAPSAATPAKDAATSPSGLRTVLFGAGCFWGVELAFARVRGVVETTAGYAGGSSKNPSYSSVCGGATGHAEVVRVVHDPAVVSLKDLLKVFADRHDPTVANRVGNDVGTQYRSAVYVETDAEADEVRAWAAKVAAKRHKPVTTEIRTGVPFWAAEESHQRYLEKRGQVATKGATARIRCYG